MTGAAVDATVLVDRGRFALDVELSVAAGETVAVMGPSGAGKSTLLETLAGLVRLDRGVIRIGETVVDALSPRAHVPPMRRGVVLLGQEPRLFPHFSARENVAFGPRAAGVDRRVAAADADEWLWRVGLGGMGGHSPNELSGGQQQRVAIARALARSPRAVLLDEPLTALDPETADGIRAMVHEQLAATHTTAIVATHTALDAVALARRLVVLERGRITQQGAVRDVLEAPATRFVAAVAGLNRVVGRVDGGRWHSGAMAIAAEFEASVRDGAAAAVFSPAAVHMQRTDATSWTAALRLAPRADDDGWLARVTRLEQTPAGVRVRTEAPAVAVDVPAHVAAGLDLRPGTPVVLSVRPRDVRVQPIDDDLDSPGEPDPPVPARR